MRELELLSQEEADARIRFENCLDELYECLMIENRSWRTLIQDFYNWLDEPREAETEAQRQQRRVLQSKFDTLYAWLLTQKEIR